MTIINNRLIFVLALSLVLTACKVYITVPEGGRIVSESGAYDCASETVCVIDVVDLFFDEILTATPAQGYVFVDWKSRDSGFFGGDTTPSVRLYTSDLAAIPALSAFLETEDIFYLEPNFALAGPSTISLVGTWATTESYDICPNELTVDYSAVEVSLSGGMYTFSQTFIDDIGWDGMAGNTCYASESDDFESGQFSGPMLFTPQDLADLVGEEDENSSVVINSADQFTHTAQFRVGAANEVVVTFIQIWTRQ